MRQYEILIQWVFGGEWVDLQRFPIKSEGIAELIAVRKRMPQHRYRLVHRTTETEDLEREVPKEPTP